MTAPFTTPFKFKDVETDEIHFVQVEEESQGISVKIPGYGTDAMIPGAGPVVLIEMREGIPHVVIFGDINKEEPSHVISLEGASEKFRRPD